MGEELSPTRGNPANGVGGLLSSGALSEAEVVPPHRMARCWPGWGGVMGGVLSREAKGGGGGGRNIGFGMHVVEISDSAFVWAGFML